MTRDNVLRIGLNHNVHPSKDLVGLRTFFFHRVACKKDQTHGVARLIGTNCTYHTYPVGMICPVMCWNAIRNTLQRECKGDKLYNMISKESDHEVNFDMPTLTQQRFIYSVKALSAMIHDNIFIIIITSHVDIDVVIFSMFTKEK